MVSRDTLPAVVYRLGHLGDVALLTGVLSHWRETRGDTFVVVTRKANAPLLANHPAVAEVVGLEDADLHGIAWLREARRLAAAYRRHPLLDLHGTLRSHLLALVWHGPVRRYPKFALARRLFARTRADRFRTALEALNVPQRYALTLDATPPDPAAVTPRLFPAPNELAAASARLAPLTTPGRPLVALHPYATHPAKQWPRSHWLALTCLLAAADMDWIVVGRADEPLFPRHAHDLTNTTDLRATCALIARADALVTADSGPMHLGTGTGTPVVALFGPTAKVWGFLPSGPRDRVLERDLPCRPCSLHGGRPCNHGHRCMTELTPAHVLTTVRDVCGETEKPPAAGGRGEGTPL